MLKIMYHTYIHIMHWYSQSYSYLILLVSVARGRARFVIPTYATSACRNRLTWSLTRFGDEREERFHLSWEDSSLSLPSLSSPTTLCVAHTFMYPFPVLTSSLPKRKPYLFLSSCKPNLKCRPNILTCALETNSLWLKTISFTKQNLHPCNFVAWWPAVQKEEQSRQPGRHRGHQSRGRTNQQVCGLPGGHSHNLQWSQSILLS